MKDYLTNEIQNTLPTLLKLGVMDKPQTPIESYINTIRTGDNAKLPFLLEFFENIFSKKERAVINPLIEKISIEERSNIGHEHFSNLPNDLDKEISNLIFSKNIDLFHIPVPVDLTIYDEKKISQERTISLATHWGMLEKPRHIIFAKAYFYSKKPCKYHMKAH